MSFLPESLTFHYDPVWPWSLSLGLPALAIVALALVILTRWTYHGVGEASRSRVSLLITLRLTALILACLVLLRPSLASRDDLQFPSTLLFLIDSSESMTIQDEADGKSRWDYLQRILTSANPHLRSLREEHNVSIMTYRFAEDLGDYSANTKADGKRTDFGQALQALFGQHGRRAHPAGPVSFFGRGRQRRPLSARPAVCRSRPLAQRALPHTNLRPGETDDGRTRT